MTKIKRDLDGVYFRVKRENKFVNLCFSDLTKEEMHEVLKEKSKEWCENLSVILAESLYELGEHFDVIRM